MFRMFRVHVVPKTVAADFNRRFVGVFVREFIRPGRIALCVVLSGCSIPANPLTGSGSVRDLLHTASGYVIEGTKQGAAVIELGKMGFDRAKETAADLQRRAGDLQQGVESVKKGKELIEKGLGK